MGELDPGTSRDGRTRSRKNVKALFCSGGKRIGWYPYFELVLKSAAVRMLDEL
jgi:hypothetical protein